MYVYIYTVGLNGTYYDTLVWKIYHCEIRVV